MNKETIIVPKGIRYLGQWEGFHLSNFPAKCIINKVIPGCGFTRFCIESPYENVILCSPRKMLLQNKYEQHSSLCYLVRNELEQDPGVDMDIAKDRKVIDQDNPDKNYSTEVKAKLHKELREYFSTHIQYKKILVTYDSFRILKEVLQEQGVFQNFYVIVDEFQAIMQDSRFKSSTEINFLYHLQNSHSALFVSATPMLEEYLDYLNEFKNLPYFEFDWKTKDLSRVVKPDLEIKKMTSIITETRKIIEKFKSGQYDSLKIIDKGIPNIRFATELVFYVNSVAAIIKIIKSNNLQDSEVNILCSNTEENQKKIWQKLGKKNGYNIGRVPLEGEPRKPVTLCTRTVYLGADFYSDCAKSYIFSDPNSDYLSVDISQDLPQILGRQRCDENPWKNSATFFYKTIRGENKKTKEEFDAILDEKYQGTLNLINIWKKSLSDEKKSFVKILRNSILAAHYRDDYAALNREEVIDPITGCKTYQYLPVINELVRISEKRAFDIQQIDYADRFSVFTAISEEFNDGFSKDTIDQDPIEFQVTEFFRIYDTISSITDRLKLLCETPLTDRARDVVLSQLPDTDKVKYFYTALGPERCRANSYKAKRISEEIGVKYFSKKEISKEIYKIFNIGDKLLNTEIKKKIKEIYDRIGYDKTPKATDLLEYFETKRYQAIDPVSRKRINGYELIKKLL